MADDDELLLNNTRTNVASVRRYIDTINTHHNQFYKLFEKKVAEIFENSKVSCLILNTGVSLDNCMVGEYRALKKIEMHDGKIKFHIFDFSDKYKGFIDGKCISLLDLMIVYRKLLKEQYLLES